MTTTSGTTQATRAICYVRVSTTEQLKNNSPEAQIADTTQYAAKHGMTVIDRVIEDFTGYEIDRPKFTALIKLADAGGFDALLIQHPDRLGRDFYLGLALHELTERGILVYSCNRGLLNDPADETAQLMNSADQFISGAERRAIRRRFTTGAVSKVVNAKRLLANGAAALYGYSWTGFRRERELTINPDEAGHLRWIFEAYDQGMPVTQIATDLERRCIPRPSTEQTARNATAGHGPYFWRQATIYKMLRHRSYIGEFTAFRTHNRTNKTRLHATPITIDRPDLAILDRALFDRVQARLDSGRITSKRNTQRVYVLRSRLHCACGKNMVGQTSLSKTYSHSYYRCAARIRVREQLEHCTEAPVRMADADAAVWGWIVANVLDEQTLLIGLGNLDKRSESEKQRTVDALAYCDQQIADLDAEADRWDQLFVARLTTLAKVEANKGQIARRIAALNEQRRELAAKAGAGTIGDDDRAYILDLVRATKAQIATLTDEGRQKVLEILNVTARLGTIEGERCVHIDVALPRRRAGHARLSTISPILYDGRYNQQLLIYLSGQAPLLRAA